MATRAARPKPPGRGWGPDHPDPGGSERAARGKRRCAVNARSHHPRAPTESLCGRSQFTLTPTVARVESRPAEGSEGMHAIGAGLVIFLGVLPAAAWAQSPEQHLAEAIRFETISHESAAAFNAAPFLALHRWLETTYPTAHQVLQREKIGAASLLYTWPGSDASLPPFILTSHLDVVPVPDPETWTHP